MKTFMPWNSQPLDAWAERYAEGSFIELAGRKTHYVERGQGKPVLLIHGFNMDFHTWMKSLDVLAGRYKVYALDLWGQGYSTRQPLDYGYNLFEEQVRLFMQAKDIQKASLVGHSMGGGTSIVFAARNPQQVDKLVLLDSTGIPTRLPFRSKIFRIRGVAELLLALRTDAVRRMNLLDFWIHKKELLTEDAFAMLTRYQKVRGTTEALLTILRRNFFNTLEATIQELGQRHIPTLIIWGRMDRTLPLHCGERMHQLLPGSRFEILENAAHLANFDRAEDFNRIVIDFLSEEPRH